eukprot:CAMPEP_0116104978 /NCGR_PEP_ID=MMETSP0327-20121206/14764_1 /TAXON_ID=44447 /ORGANISM="Pseudo-nitzschia delicatissima, Strain B596" /LENGTH=258 /DNA_ID=CAMNT_0003597307 /DNA_START=1 /DNA_END=777 /DNA_ORIENTATION=-
MRTIVWVALAVIAITLFLEAESFAPSSVSSSVVSQSKQHQKNLVLKSSRNDEEETEELYIGGASNRRSAMTRMVTAPLVVAAMAVAPAFATDEAKQTNLADEDLLKIVVDKDLVQNQFLVNGKLTRSVYDESCTFQDEIDTYGLEKWMTGTAKLFDGDRSKVVIVPDSVKIGKEDTGRLIQFRFVEYLCFNVPAVKPIVYLSGTLFLKVSDIGLITSYREKWDQDIYKVLTSESKLFTSGIPKESLDADLDVFYKANA